MEQIWFWSFVGGIIATVIMDLGAVQFRRFDVNDGLGGLLGRWVLGFVKLEFFINGIVELETKESAKEAKVGFIFHYLVGGGIVALAYPAWFVITGISIPENHVFPGLIFGLISVGLTWFVQ